MSYVSPSDYVIREFEEKALGENIHYQVGMMAHEIHTLRKALIAIQTEPNCAHARHTARRAYDARCQP